MAKLPLVRARLDCGVTSPARYEASAVRTYSGSSARCRRAKLSTGGLLRHVRVAVARFVRPAALAAFAAFEFVFPIWKPCALQKQFLFPQPRSAPQRYRCFAESS